MTQDQFIQSEVYKLVKFQNPGLTQLQVVQKVTKINYHFSEDGKQILLEGDGYNDVFGWSDKDGIFDLDDGDREFDEKFQEGEI